MYRVVGSVSPSLPQSEKFVQYILLLTIVVIGLRKPCTKIEVGAGIELNYMYCGHTM
jgi:hypothetical protein